MNRPSRLFFIPYLLQRWQGPFVFVIYCSDSELDSSITTYLTSNPPNRVTTLFYSHSRKNMYAKDFPVNLLRNVGIRMIQTSHFLVLDMDMWVNSDEQEGR